RRLRWSAARLDFTVGSAVFAVPDDGRTSHPRPRQAQAARGSGRAGALNGRGPFSAFTAVCSVGAPGRIRTADTRFRRAVLYPLSYGGVMVVVNHDHPV